MQIYADFNENIIRNEISMNTEILIEHLKHKNPSNLLKDLYNSIGTKN